LSRFHAACLAYCDFIGLKYVCVIIFPLSGDKKPHGQIFQEFLVKGQSTMRGVTLIITREASLVFPPVTSGKEFLEAVT
jgi:hypothetical protein